MSCTANIVCNQKGSRGAVSKLVPSILYGHYDAMFLENYTQRLFLEILFPAEVNPLPNTNQLLGRVSIFSQWTNFKRRKLINSDK